MNIDDLFIPNTQNASKTLSGNYPDFHTRNILSSLKYPDWVVKGVQNGFNTSFTIELNRQMEKCSDNIKFPDGRPIKKDVFDALPDDKFFLWLSERICSILDVSLVPHSTVCFDLQRFRTYNSLRVYTFVAFLPAPAKFFKTIYQLYSLGRYCSECMHIYVKLRCEYYTEKYNLSGDMTVDISVDYLELMNQLCEFVYLIQTFDPNKTDNYEKFKYYQQFFKFKLFNTHTPVFLKEPLYIRHSSKRMANDIHTMLEVIWNALEKFNHIFVLSDKDFNRYFIEESMLFLRLFRKKMFKHKYINFSREYAEYILKDFWKECTKDVRKKCEDDIYNYIRERL